MCTLGPFPSVIGKPSIPYPARLICLMLEIASSGLHMFSHLYSCALSILIPCCAHHLILTLTSIVFFASGAMHTLISSQLAFKANCKWPHVETNSCSSDPIPQMFSSLSKAAASAVHSPDCKCLKESKGKAHT